MNGNQPPNILFVFSDQQHWEAVGFADASFETPNQTRLASEGIVFRNAFCTTPQCSPSRSSIMTGLYPSRTGVWGNIGSAGGNPLQMRTIGARLRESGYRTAYFGKWHLGKDPVGTDGWDEDFGVTGPETTDDREVTRRAIRFLQATGKTDRPFALFLSYNNPHDIYHFDSESDPTPKRAVALPQTWHDKDLATVPFVQQQFMTEDQGRIMTGAGAPAWERYRELYREKVKLYDEELGRVLAALKDRDLDDSTLVIATSDHGDMDGQHRLIYKGPFMYEHMMRVPLIIRPPAANRSTGSRTVDFHTVNVDLVPTLAEFAGIEIHDTDGVSLKPFIELQAPFPERPFVVGQYYSKQKWVNPTRMVRTAHYKYNRYQKHGEELYDLAKDPMELQNRAHDPGCHHVKQELASILTHWMDDNGDPFDTQFPTTREGNRLTIAGDDSGLRVKLVQNRPPLSSPALVHRNAEQQSKTGASMSRRMNVLHIIADQHHAGCLGHEGHPQVISPNLDRLAASGLRFTRCYTQNTICTPSRVSLISGQYCHNHGFYGLYGPRPDWLPGSFSHFKKHGYRTAGIGKLHLPITPRIWLENDFDTCLDSYTGNDGKPKDTPWCREIVAKGLQDKHEFYQSNLWGEPKQRASVIPFDMSQEGWSVREAIRFMDGCGEAPFCMQVSFERPHDPCVPAREFWDMYPDDIELPKTFTYPCDHRPPHFREMHATWRKETGADYVAAAKRRWKGYLACITHTDHAVGRLLDYLDKSGLAANTIVIYNADHGAYMSQYGIYEKAPGLCSEAVCRVPSLWRVPGVTPAGQACTQLTENVDMAPTFAALCGLPAMPWADGLDITSLLSGGNQPVRELAAIECPHSKAIRWGKWRFVHYQPETFGEDVGELYDGEADPEETRNLYHVPAYRETVAQCRRMLLEWLIRTTRIRTGWGVHGVDHKNKLYPDAGDGRMPLPKFGSCKNYE